MTILRIFLPALALILPAVLQAETAPLLKRAEASRVLYDAGVDLRDPVLILAAAKLRRSLGLRQTDRQPEAGETEQDTILSWETMLSAARDLATGDPLMLGLIEDAEAETIKGVLNGQVYNNGRLAGKQSDTYRNVPFQGGVYAEIYVEAKGDQDMNIHIYDAKNRLVCSDTDSSAISYCGWRPRKAGSFTIKVSNESSTRAQYKMITN